MRVLFSCLATLLVLITSSQAGQLTVAVLAFSGENDPAELTAALSGENLVELTSGERITRGAAVLRSGTVVFSQTVGIVPGTRFESDTRLRGLRAVSSYLLTQGQADVKIHIEELVSMGITKRRAETYLGTGPLSPGQTIVLGMKQQKIRKNSASRSSSGGVSSTVQSSASQLAVVAQYTS